MDDILLKDIFVGKADGLQEAQDDRFENMFYKNNNKYETLVREKDKFLITGRKGTGKTILAKYFEKEHNTRNIISKMITDRDIVLRQLIEKGYEDLDKKEVEVFVEYTILHEIAKIIIKNKNKFYFGRHKLRIFRKRKHLKYLESAINDRNEVGNYRSAGYKTLVEQETAATNEANINIKRFSTKANSIIKNREGRDVSYERNPYYNQNDKIKEAMMFLLKCVNVNLLFDDLDEYDEVVAGNSKFIKFFVSFISVAYDINRDFANAGIDNSRVILLVRSDILKVLNNHSSNLNKILADSEVRLNWIKKMYSSRELHPLMDMLLSKIKKSNPILINKSKGEIFNIFFPVKIDGIPVMDYMLNNSYGRPRDIINMLNIIRDMYPNANKFSSSHFKKVQLEYSEKFVDELRNELSSHCCGEKIDECFFIIKTINSRSFWKSDVENVFNKYVIYHFSSSTEYLEFAYKFGILGNVWKNEDNFNRRKQNFSWKYREDGSDFPYMDKRFCVHYALRRSFIR